MLDTVTVSGTLHHPIADVFDFVVDSRNDQLWCPMASDCTLVEGAPGVDAVYTFLQDLGPGRSVATRIRTTVATRPHRIEWQAESGARYHATVTLQDRAGHTRMTQRNRVSMPNPVLQVAWFAMAQVVLRRQLRHLDRVLVDRS